MIRFLLGCLCLKLNRERSDSYFFIVNYLVSTTESYKTKIILLCCISHYLENGFFTEGQKFALFKEFNCA